MFDAGFLDNEIVDRGSKVGICVLEDFELVDNSSGSVEDVQLGEDSSDEEDEEEGSEDDDDDDDSDANLPNGFIDDEAEEDYSEDESEEDSE